MNDMQKAPASPQENQHYKPQGKPKGQGEKLLPLLTEHKRLSSFCQFL